MKPWLKAMTLMGSAVSSRARQTAGSRTRWRNVEKRSPGMPLELTGGRGAAHAAQAEEGVLEENGYGSSGEFIGLDVKAMRSVS